MRSSFVFAGRRGGRMRSSFVFAGRRGGLPIYLQFSEFAQGAGNPLDTCPDVLHRGREG